jgi:uncharacterized protein
MKISWDIVVILLILAALIPWRGLVRIRKLLRRDQIATPERLVIYASTIAFQWLLAGIAAVSAYFHHISIADLGLVIQSPAKTAGVALGFCIALGVLQYVGIRQTAKLPQDSPSRLRDISLRLMPRSAIEALAFSALAVTAALCEEFLYRGFVFAVLYLASGSWLIALIGSSLLFGLAHSYQGVRGLITTFALGLIFAASRIWVGNLIPAIAAHLIVDLMAGYIAPRYLARKHATPAEEAAPTTQS